MDQITLNNGVTIPQVGLGTYLLEPDDAQSAVTYALDNGYTLIDTANVYVNERAVGRGMLASSKAREEIFLETKLWPSFFERPTAVDETLERLGTDYIDLMILHQPAGDTVAGYRILEKAHKEGKIRAIGLSNFDVAQTQRILDECEVVPTINQVECHPYFPQTELKELLKEHNIALQAWYPLGGRGNASIMSEPVIEEIAKTHGKSPAQVILRWHVQLGHSIVPGSKTPSHIAENLDLFNFELTNEEMAQINGLDKGEPIFQRTPEVEHFFATFMPDVDSEK